MFDIHQIPTTLNLMLFLGIKIRETVTNGYDEEGCSLVMIFSSKWLMDICFTEFVVMFVDTGELASLIKL